MAVVASYIDFPNNRRLVKVVIGAATDLSALDLFDGPANVVWFHGLNAQAADNYLKLYDAVEPTVGTTAPDVVREIPATGTNGGQRFEVFDDGAGTTISGLPFTTAVSAAVVTAGGTGGTTNPSSNVTITLYGIRTST